MKLKCKKQSGFRIPVIPVLILIASVITGSCKVSYSFSGASTTGLKTFSVQYFQNRASLVQPALSETLTNALIDKCQSQTSLAFSNTIADANFEGEITDYNTKPYTASAAGEASTNRFTISVKVKYTNSIDPDLSFEQTFTRYADYDSASELSQVEDELSKTIIDEIVEDIFNRAFVNW